jgi:putative Mg2+ transporter-C (MgtC) family protein
MTGVWLTFILPIVGSLIAGGMIGLEREYRSRPAGLRTHILISLSCTLLMLAAVHQVLWLSDTPHDVIRIDPVRMAHGILTGIGFLCGGVIFRQGFTVHGLTTAASMWMTAALGTLWGVGFFALAAGGTAVTLVVLTLFRIIDERMPQLTIIDVTVRYRREAAFPEVAFRAVMGECGLDPSGISHRLVAGGELVELSATLRSAKRVSAATLSARLYADASVVEFDVVPRDD